MTNRSPIQCVAFVSSKSNRLAKFYMDDTKEEELLTCQFAMYASLDEIDRLVGDKMLSRSQGQSLDSELGLLCNLGPLSIFGYMTKTRSKILIGVNQTVLPQKDLSKVFVELHKSYISHVVRNPFVKELHDGRNKYALSAQNAPKFHENVRHIVQQYNGTI